jgi:hypothetical protein
MNNNLQRMGLNSATSHLMRYLTIHMNISRVCYFSDNLMEDIPLFHPFHSLISKFLSNPITHCYK